MSTHTPAENHHTAKLAKDAKALIAATAHLAEEKVTEARNRVAATLENAGELAEQVRDQTVKSAKAADRAVRANPYRAIGIALGIGALLGILIARRRPQNND
jgi:ElaB/YqjD/DUF883 family membrane-anchored ribosome-binding protein